MQLAIKKKKYFFEILKKKSLNPELNNTSYDKGKKRFLPPKYLKKNLLTFNINILQQRKRKIFRSKYLKKNLATSHSISMHLTTKKRKISSIEIFKKRSRNLAFDINILQQRKKKDSFDRNIKKKASSLETRWYSTSISRNKFKSPWINKKYDPRRHQPV